VALGAAAPGDAAVTAVALTAAAREDLPAGREAASLAVPHQVALRQEPARRARPRAGMAVGTPAAAQPEVAGRAAAQEETQAYRLREATASAGICQAAAGRGPATAPRTG
jgi:hypothetical protein